MMQASTSGSERLLYQEHDRIPMPEDVPALGLRKGDEGIVRRLDLHNDAVFAFVMVSYSTGQTRGWVILELKPDLKVRSYTIAPFLPRSPEPWL